MPRVKGGTVTRQRRKKMIKLAKGYRGSKHIQFKVAKQQVMKSYQYAFRDRRKTKSNFRKLWTISGRKKHLFDFMILYVIVFRLLFALYRSAGGAGAESNVFPGNIMSKYIIPLSFRKMFLMHKF